MIVPVLLGVGLVGVVLLASGRSSAAAPQACVERWAVHHGGKRNMRDVRVIVIHSTEGDTAAGAAGWFQNEASRGSAHIVVDDEECYRTLPDDVVPWGAPGANEDGLHVEMAGHASWTRAQWLEHRRTIQRAAAATAVWGRIYRIPMRFVDAAGLRRGERGVTTHAEVTKAYSGGAGHNDPGLVCSGSRCAAGKFPIDVFMASAGGRAPERLAA